MITFSQILVCFLSIPMMSSGCFEILEAHSALGKFYWDRLAWGLFLVFLDAELIGWATQL